ncbi:MAG: hypothetical protein JW931_02295 [Methanomicrobiaceae archaeon]|nr:hypothetical protein [Methanomicrobiaceae archaeon]
MRTTCGDRRGSRIFIVCAALILLAAIFCPSSALDADIYIAENGSVFHAEVAVNDAESYEFNEPGMLGEKVPVEVSNISLVDESGADAAYEEKWNSISFEKGNYTVGFDQEFGNNDFRVLMDNPYNITLYLPDEYNVANPLLGMVSTGGSVNRSGDFTIISWKMKNYAEARFYDDLQEKMLLAFGSFWLVLVLIFLVPYLIVRRKTE